MDTVTVKITDADMKASFNYLREMANEVGTHESSRSLIADNGYYLRLECGLTIAEKEVIDEEATAAAKAEREAKINELKAKYGDEFVDVAMLPDQVEQKDEQGNAVLDEEGNPIMMPNNEKQRMIMQEKKDENGNTIMITQQRPVFDEDGKQKTDEEGHLVFEDVEVPDMEFVTNPMWVDPVYDVMKKVPEFDSFSNFHFAYSYPPTEKEEYVYYEMEDYEEDVPDYEMKEVDVPDVEWREVDVLDENGNPVFEDKPVLDENGQQVLDENGQPKTEKVQAKQMQPFELETTHKEMRQVETGTTHKETRSRAVEKKEVRDKPNYGCLGGHDVTKEMLNGPQAKAKFIEYLAKEDVKAGLADLEQKIGKKIVIELDQ